MCIFRRSPAHEHVSAQIHFGFFQLRNTLHMNPADARAMVYEMIPDFQSMGRFKARINHLWLNRFPGKLEEGEAAEAWKSRTDCLLIFHAVFKQSAPGAEVDGSPVHGRVGITTVSGDKIGQGIIGEHFGKV